MMVGKLIMKVDLDIELKEQIYGRMFMQFIVMLVVVRFLM